MSLQQASLNYFYLFVTSINHVVNMFMVTIKKKNPNGNPDMLAVGDVFGITRFSFNKL